jgi:predicted RNA binding protein YcfA (HicA-like mRNA interferase family)
MNDAASCCPAILLSEALQRDGYIPVHQRGSHRYFTDPLSADRLTTIPLHAPGIHRSLLRKILRSLGYSRKEIDELL